MKKSLKMKKSVKKALSIVLVLSMVFSMSACGKKSTGGLEDTAGKPTEVVSSEATNTPEPTATSEATNTPETTATPEDASATENQPTATPEPTPMPESTSTPEPTPTPKPTPAANPFTLPESEALDFIHNLKIGWNLGNSFDAYDCTWLSDEMEYESGWCKAKASEQLFDELKKAGFNTVRIPVSWHNHLSDKSNYTISEPWLNRVNEVVDYAIKRDMYVIINIHHDNSEKFLYPSSKYLDQSIAYVTAIWRQLSERFKGYDEHLLFGCMNEPRLVGHANEWWIDPNSADCKDAIACINKINQAFVDTVRASGGNNATRYLICPGYDASPEGALNEGFVLPTDPADNDHRIVISAHAYTPYNFALEMPGVSEWSSSKAKDASNLVGFMNKLYETYVSQGQPVIIDEFGALDKGGNLDSRVDFAGYYVKAARMRGMSCIWWDNNAFQGDGELFGLIDRAKCEWRYLEIVQAMMASLQEMEEQ